jgi:hypothetical protein
LKAIKASSWRSRHFAFCIGFQSNEASRDKGFSLFVVEGGGYIPNDQNLVFFLQNIVKNPFCNGSSFLRQLNNFEVREATDRCLLGDALRQKSLAVARQPLQASPSPEILSISA